MSTDPATVVELAFLVSPTAMVMLPAAADVPLLLPVRILRDPLCAVAEPVDKDRLPVVLPVPVLTEAPPDEIVESPVATAIAPEPTPAVAE